MFLNTIRGLTIGQLEIELWVTLLHIRSSLTFRFVPVHDLFTIIYVRFDLTVLKSALSSV